MLVGDCFIRSANELDETYENYPKKKKKKWVTQKYRKKIVQTGIKIEFRFKILSNVTKTQCAQ